MHRAVHQFIKEVKKELPYKFRLRRVLEVGSHDINGSPRKYFWFCSYLGIDITPGKGVDIVGKFTDIEYTDQFGVVISTEMLEHDKDWKESLYKMYNLLEDGGLMIITCAAPYRKEHGTKRTTPGDSPDTTDYYNNISKGMFETVLKQEMFSVYVLQYARGENDLQFYGIKKIVQNITAKAIYERLLQGDY